MLLTLASLPLLVLPSFRGAGVVQPVHVDDLVDAVVALVEGAAAPRCVALVGPQPLGMAAYLQALRGALGLGPGVVLALPLAGARWAARLRLPWLTPDSLRLLRAGSYAPVDATVALLGRAPRAPSQFIDPPQRDELRRAAVLAWALPLLRGAIAAVWLATALVSAGLYPVADSRAMLGAVGVPAALQTLLLYGAAALDALLGLLTLAAPSRTLWRLQIALMLFYMAVITVGLPEYWLHPFGPLTKNLPMLAALLLLDALTPRSRWTST